MGSSVMKLGAVAIFDCLGFKGIWSRENPTILMKKLLSTEDNLLHDLTVEEDASTLGLTVTSLKLLSDTVVISVLPKDESNSSDTFTIGAVVDEACRATAYVLSHFIGTKPLFVMRGCITYGQHLIERNFLLGPAVDASAEVMNIAEGGFVWLHPNAAEIYRKHKVKLEANYGLGYPTVIDPYEMPIKRGGKLKCPVVNPFSFFDSPTKRRDTLESYSNRKGERPETWIKHQNTLDFLLMVDEELSGYERASAERLAQLKGSLDPS